VLSVLRLPGVLTLFVTSCIARLPMGALGLLLILHTEERSGSYAQGGLAAGAYMLALGVSNPVLGRVVDRRGQTLVLRTGAPIAAAAIVLAALLPADAPFALLLVAAAVAGLAQPPIGACMRALWPTLLDSADARHAAYALESVVIEIVYICGPLVIVAAIGSWSIVAALLVCAGTLLFGDLAFSVQRSSRTWRPRTERARDRAGALRGSGVRVLVAVFALCGLGIGAIEVAVPAILESVGERDLTGVLLALWGVGSMLAGIVAGRMGAASDPPRRLATMLVAWGATHMAVGLATAPLTLGLTLLIAGAAIAPTLVVGNGMLDWLSPAGTLTEAFTWTTTGLGSGIALGSSLAGALVEAASPGVAVVVLCSGGLLAAVLVRAAAAGPLRAPQPAAIHLG
jgi:MFS family permease